MTFFQHRDFLRGLPFYGQKGDFNFVTGRSKYTPGISIRLVPLKDMSRNADVKPSDFQNYVSHIKNFFKPGDRVRGTEVNSQFEGEGDEGVEHVGRFHKFEFDYKNQRVRTFLQDPETLSVTEVYPETMIRIMESVSHGANMKYIKTYDDFCI